MSEQDPYEQPIPEDSYAAWWAQAYDPSDDPEVQRLRELLEQQRQEANE